MHESRLIGGVPPSLVVVGAVFGVALLGLLWRVPPIRSS